jgi:hypothetical protein
MGETKELVMPWEVEIFIICGEFVEWKMIWDNGLETLKIDQRWEVENSMKHGEFTWMKKNIQDGEP